MSWKAFQSFALYFKAFWYRANGGLAASLHRAAKLTIQLEQHPDLTLLMTTQNSAATSQTVVPEEFWWVHQPPEHAHNHVDQLIWLLKEQLAYWLKCRMHRSMPTSSLPVTLNHMLAARKQQICRMLQGPWACHV